MPDIFIIKNTGITMNSLGQILSSPIYDFPILSDILENLMSPVSYLPYQHVPQNCEVTVLTVFNCKKTYIFVEMPTNRQVLHRGKAFILCSFQQPTDYIYFDAVPMDQKSVLATGIRCHLFCRACYPIAGGEADAASGFP